MQTKRLTTMVAAAVTAACIGHAPVLAAASTVTSVPASLNEAPTRWFVEFAGAPTADGGKSAALGKQRADFRKAATGAGLSFKERYDYQTLWNGMAIEITGGDAGKLKGLQGVAAVYPVVNVEAPPRAEDDGIEPDVMSAITQTGVDIARSSLGLTGEGVKVAIIDTGIDYDHPDLGGGFGSGYKVAYGYDFVGDNYDASGDTGSPIPVPDDDPDDCQGHGTHVSGIVGAKAAGPNGVTGVAPDVTLGAYRVFGCDGSSSADVIIAALERAYADGMQVVNQSLGAAFQWPQYPTAVVGDRLVQKGVVVVASAGNNGSTGTFSIGAPGVGTDVIGVASFDNVAVTVDYAEVNGEKIEYIPMTFAGPTPKSGSGEVVYVGRACNGDLPLLADPAGKIALATRGACSFNEKATNAINAGAAAVLIHNSAPGLFNGTLGSPIDGTTPVVGISLEDGLFLQAQAAPITLEWKDGTTTSPNPTANLISSFSSYGLSPDLALKPDLGAPGGSIYSTYVMEKSNYTILSGTSMSAPHVAGAVALMLEYAPKTKAKDVRDRLQNSADPKVWSLVPGLGFLDHVHRQGAGMLDIDDAILAKVGVSPGKLSLGESEAGPQARRLKVTNRDKQPVTLSLSYTNALTTTRSIPNFNGGANGLGFFLSDAAVSFAADTVTVPGSSSMMVDVLIEPASGPDGGLYGGYIVMTPDNGEDAYRVPFAGYVGDYQAIEPLDGSAFGLPWLARLSGGSFFRLDDVDPDADRTFTLEGDDQPQFLVFFEHQTRRVEMQVVEAASGRPVHPVFSNFEEIDYLGRNTHRSTFFAFAWDGTRSHDNGKGTPNHRKFVADGEYRIVVKALKAEGDAANPDHWQTWVSPVVIIDRP